jgi:hypothetical protein
MVGTIVGLSGRVRTRLNLTIDLRRKKMFRKLVLAVTLALGLGGGGFATQSAEAAVVGPVASATVTQAIEQAPFVTGAQQVYYYRHGGYHRGGAYYRGGGYRGGYYHGGGYRRYGYYGGGYRRYGYYGGGYGGCRYTRVRVATAYGWRWVGRRVCY